MIQKISIKNFKSVHSNEMELGRFNVLIGENGSGKSNLLEAIAFGGAASGNMLGNEFLVSRGIRMTKPELMFSAFGNSEEERVAVAFFSEIEDTYTIEYSENRGWVESRLSTMGILGTLLKNYFEVDKSKANSMIKGLPNKIEAFEKLFKEEGKKLSDKEKKDAIILYPILEKAVIKSGLQEFPQNKYIARFLIYSPENTALRNFFDEGQITPLGIRGEGLFSLLKEISQEKKGSRFKKIIDSLKIIDWFDGLELGANGFPGEKVIKIKDKYIADSIDYIDQRSTNEGFLFLLFYITLFVSDKTPDFFAIDNIESSFNPKLCTKLIQVLAKLAKEHKKQVIVTTHSPFILDGLNLADDDQRLFVVRRNMEGHTITNRIQPKEKTNVPLSEAWMRGYLGGLPNNF